MATGVSMAKRRSLFSVSDHIAMTLEKILAQAGKEKWATGHFNASEADQMCAIVDLSIDDTMLKG